MTESRPSARWHVSTLVPVAAGESGVLATVLTALAGGPASPLAAVPGTHYGRWVVVDRWGPQVLLFSAITDRPAAPYLRSVLDHIPETADAVWSHCPGWPGTGDAGLAAGWLAAHVVDPGLAFGTWQASVEDIRTGLALRTRLSAFAVGAQRLAPGALRQAFVEEFGP